MPLGYWTLCRFASLLPHVLKYLKHAPKLYSVTAQTVCLNAWQDFLKVRHQLVHIKMSGLEQHQNVGEVFVAPTFYLAQSCTV